MKSISLPPWLVLSIKYSIGASLIFWLFKNETLDWSLVRSVPMLFIGGAFSLVVIQLFLSAYRIRSLMRAHDIDVPLKTCVLFNSVGIFYSVFLPGGISGDLARMYFFVKEFSEKSKTSMTAVLFIDRLIGMSTMILVGMIAATFSLGNDIFLTNYVTYGWCFFVISGVVFVLLTKRVSNKVNGDSDYSGRGFYRVFVRFFAKLDLSCYPVSTLGFAIVISSAIHLISMVILYLFSLHVASGLSLLEVIAVSPIGFLVNAVPVTPGGLGIGEKSFDVLFRAVGGYGGGTSFLITRIFLYSPAFIGIGFMIYRPAKQYLRKNV